MRTLIRDRATLSQLLLVIAGTLIWNISGLLVLLERHKYMRRPDWGVIIILSLAVLVLVLTGLIWLICFKNGSRLPVEIEAKSRRVTAIRTGFAIFLLGWVLCWLIMMRIMALEPWCIMGVAGAVLGDWLPVGVGVTVAMSFLSWLIAGS
jgi:hypothetical protein